MRRFLIAALLVLLPGLAVGQDFIRYYPAAGVSSTSPTLFPDGTAAAPSIAFSGGVQTGLYRPAANQLGIAFGGFVYAMMSLTALNLGQDQYIHFTSGSPLSAANDVYVVQDAAATLQLGLDAATATAQTLKAADSTGANVAGGNLTLRGGAGTSGNATGGQLILGGGALAGTGERGAVQIEDGGTRPTCAAGIRGSLWYEAGGAGVADKFEICAKQAAGDTYAWRTAATIP